MHQAGYSNRMAAKGSACMTGAVAEQSGGGGGYLHDEQETTGRLPAATDECSAVFVHIHWRHVCVSNSAVSMNHSGVFYVCRENLSMWEKIACGEVEDVVPSPPYDSGPVKVDNWLPKSLLARQRNTTCILPRTSYSVGGRTHILCCRDTDQLKATWLWKLSYLIGWRRCRHWWFHQPQRQMDCQREGLKPITLHPHSLRIHLVKWTLVFFYVLFFYVSAFFTVLYVQRPYSEPFAS